MSKEKVAQEQKKETSPEEELKQIEEQLVEINNTKVQFTNAANAQLGILLEKENVLLRRKVELLTKQGGK